MTYTFDEAAAYEALLARLPEDGRARVQAPSAEDFVLPQGGRDNLDWLDGFYSESNAIQTITGLEPLQSVFADSMVDRERGFEQARILCEALVVVKFQKMLKEARPHMRKVDVPIFACAHDFEECYLAEIPPK